VPISASSRLTPSTQTNSVVWGNTKVESAVMPYRMIFTFTNCSQKLVQKPGKAPSVLDRLEPLAAMRQASQST